MFRASLILVRRASTKVRPECPLYLHSAGGVTKVSFSPAPAAVEMGHYTQEYEQELTRAFSTEPDQFEVSPTLQHVSAFIECPLFWKQAQKALKQHIHECPVFSSMAAAETKTKYFHIYDLRCPPPIGRIPEVEDILGTVELDKDGIIPYSFEPNDMYRTVTIYGPTFLSKEMASFIRRAVEE